MAVHKGLGRRAGILVAAVVACSAVFASAQRQVDGYLEVRYDDQLVNLFVQGQDVTADTAQVNPGWHVLAPVNASVTGGDLVVAATVYNGGYTGGLMINVNTTVGNAVTGPTWKWMLNPPSGWTDPSFDDANWYAVRDQGGANQTPTMVRDSSCILATDSCPMNTFIESGARFLWVPENLYFRRTFTIDSACSASVYAGSRGGYTAYLDGVKIVEVDSAETTVPARVWLTAGSHTLAMYVTTTAPLSSGTGGVLKAGIAREMQIITPQLNWFNDPPDTIGWDTTIAFRPLLVCDTLWKVTHLQQAGWSDVAFNDAGWWNAALVNDQVYPTGYPGLTQFTAGHKTIWLPQTVSFRGTITLADLGARQHSALSSARAFDLRVASGLLSVSVSGKERHTVEVFALDGHVVKRASGTGASTYQFATRDWARGTYLVRVRSGREVFTRAVTAGR